ncbi:MAG TPA: helix-turn-helix domain-containing protein [Nevskiaceae bacterium]|nr:helix-turn-helix domain-containing protein [Nevskiaceae bacterium]
MDVSVTKDYLQKAGLEPGAITVYLALHRIGPCSALQIAKSTGISRTQVYRHLEELQHFSLASYEQLSYGTLFRPLPLQNIEGTIANREVETTALRDGLGAAVEAMQQFASGGKATNASVQHYYGLAGIKQANWNLTKARHEYFVFEVAHLNDHLDKTFARRHRERCMERKIASHDLTNAGRVTAAEIEPFNPTKTFYRHIDPDILKINFEVYLYDDVVTLLDYSPDNQHAIEIHHQAMHDMMQQLYNVVWNIATPLVID